MISRRWGALAFVRCGRVVGTRGAGNLREHPSLEGFFWEALEDMDVVERAQLLSFACGSGRLPAEGFGAMRPPFTVTVERTSLDSVPTAHTCANELCLPEYGSAAELRTKLDISIHSDAGFGFL